MRPLQWIGFFRLLRGSGSSNGSILTTNPCMLPISWILKSPRCCGGWRGKGQFQRTALTRQSAICWISGSPATPISCCCPRFGNTVTICPPTMPRMSCLPKSWALPWSRVTAGSLPHQAMRRPSNCFSSERSNSREAQTQRACPAFAEQALQLRRTRNALCSLRVHHVQFTNLLLDGDGQPPYAFANLLRLPVGEVQPQVTAAFTGEPVAGSVKTVSGHEGHIFLQRHLEQLVAIHPLGQRHPQEQPALGMRPGHFRREELLQRFQHHITALAIDFSYQFDVLIKKIIFGHLVSNHLRERRSVQVGALLELDEFCNHVRRGDNPPQAQARRQRFREGT